MFRIAAVKIPLPQLTLWASFNNLQFCARLPRLASKFKSDGISTMKGCNCANISNVRRGGVISFTNAINASLESTTFYLRESTASDGNGECIYHSGLTFTLTSLRFDDSYAYAFTTLYCEVTSPSAFHCAQMIHC
jgi:hypothetical protein